VKKLERAGIIRSYHARVNPSDLGLGVQAIIQVTLARQMADPIQKFVTQINALAEVMECYQTTGAFDYELRVITKDITHFNQFITEKLSQIEEIGEFQSSIILDTIVHSSVLPLDYD